MNHYPRLILLALSLPFMTSGQAAPGQMDTVATVGKSSSVTFPELQQYVHERFYDRMYRTRPLEYAFKKALDDMIVDQLKRIDFFELGLQRDDALLQSNRRLINEELVIRYFQSEYVRKYVNDRSIRNAYEQMKRVVECRRFRVDTSAVQSARTRGTFAGVTRKLESERAGGATFDGLVSSCRRWLRIPTAAVYRDTVTWKNTPGDEADSIIFSLRAGQVRILSSPAALEIVQITGIKTPAVEPFDNVKDEIYNALRERYVGRVFDEFDSEKKALVNEKGLTWDEEALQGLLNWSNIPGFYGVRYVDTLSRAISEGRNPVLMKYRNGSVDLKEYLRLLNEVLILPPRGKFRIQDLKTFILEAVRTDKVVRKARALGLQNGVLTPGTPDPVLKDRIVSLYNQRMIDAKIPNLTEERIREFYAAHRDSLYYQLAKINIYAVISSDRRAIDSMWQMHQGGIAFEKLAHEMEVKGFIKDRFGDSIRSYLSTEQPFLGRAAFALKLNQVAGPIEYHDPDRGTLYAIIKCVEARPEKQLTLDDARKSIAADFREFQMTKIGNETAETLKNKYGYTIREDVLMRNIAVLRAK